MLMANKRTRRPFVLFALFTLVWWIVRCAKGLQRQSRGEAYENPATWLW